MATKTLKTRIQLKYDTYENWTTNNPTPLAGELCVVVVPAAAGAVAQEPAILFKVGDGTTPFNTLNFTSGGNVTVSGGGTSTGGGGTFPPMPTISMPAWTMGTFYMNSATTAKFIAYTNYIDDGVVS